MTLEGRLWTLAVAFLAAFLILGVLVASTHALSRLDAVGAIFRGRSTGLAAMFTLSGRAWALVGLGIFSVVLFVILKKPIWVPLAIFASQVASQGAVELIIKHVVARVRPSDWLVNRELGF
ncbi:MAG TPA: hypothetical protein VMS32_01445, partial [Verrucomicrobiae bacterium]|nr:hypothetical protein [Verrucomicrobiae bacterium]